MIARLRQGNLRLRLAVSAGVLTMLSIIIVGVAVWFTVAWGLRSAADDDLRTTVAAVTSVGLDRLEIDLARDPTMLGEFDSADRPAVPFVQVITSGGETLGSPLPVNDQVLEVADGERGELFEMLDFDGRSIRSLTVPVSTPEFEGALRVGSDVTSAVDGLRRARTGSLLAGLIAGLLAAVTSWFAAGKLLAPVVAVAGAADRLRNDDELPTRLDGEGPDEVGRLVGSFNQLLDELRESRDRQQRLVADVSHELRTPLTSLRVKIEFIQSEPGLDPEQRQRLLEGAVTDLSSLGDLVSELVELASEGASPERAVLVDVAEIVETEVERVRSTTGRVVEVETTAGLVETRPKQVARALSNLLGNADKYSPADQPIFVSQRGARIEVRDHGPGIPVEDRERVFERFYRGPDHRSIDGTGLGLAIVASVARNNGGEAWVRSPDDGGDGTVVGLSVGPTPS